MFFNRILWCMSYFPYITLNVACVFVPWQICEHNSLYPVKLTNHYVRIFLKDVWVTSLILLNFASVILTLLIYEKKFHFLDKLTNHYWRNFFEVCMSYFLYPLTLHADLLTKFHVPWQVNQRLSQKFLSRVTTLLYTCTLGTIVIFLLCIWCMRVGLTVGCVCKARILGFKFHL